MSNALYAYNIKSSVWFIHRQGQFNECFDICFSMHKWNCSDWLCRKDTALNIKLVEIESFIANFDIQVKNQILRKKIAVLFNFFWHFREWFLFWGIGPAELKTGYQFITLRTNTNIYGDKKDFPSYRLCISKSNSALSKLLAMKNV